jgi:integrase
MAYILKRKWKNKTTYRVQVTRKGFKSAFKSFPTRTEAKKWGRAMERKLDTGDFSNYSEASKLTLGDIMRRYISEGYHVNKKDKSIKGRVKNICNDTIADTNLLRFSTRHVAEFRERKLKHWSPTTFNKHKSLLSIVIDISMRDWEIYLPHNPMKLVKKLKQPNPRTRVLVDDEEQRLIEACASSGCIYLKPMFEFSIETAIRQGELLKIRYENINFKKRTLLLKDTKNKGLDRIIPLSQKAFFILQSQPRQFDGRVFPLTCNVLRHYWLEVMRKTKIENLRWHDLRRHAISIMFAEKNLSVPEVQLISGHADPTMLLNTYTRLDPEKLVSKLG